jgi:DNA end-binding protein Ku
MARRKSSKQKTVRAKPKTKGKAESKPSAKAKSNYREFWSGTMSIGLVTLPVQLLPAERNVRVALRQVAADGTPLRRRFYCPKHERLVDSDEIVRGYEFAPDEYVAVTDEELEALEPDKSREIDLRSFVSIDEISPLYFERSYYLTPDGDSSKAYRLLAGVLEKTRQAGIATFVMHDREYLIAIRGEGGFLRGETLRFASEVRDDGIGFDASAIKASVDKRLMSRFEKGIDSEAKASLDPKELESDVVAKLQNLIESKHKRGKDVFRIEPTEESTELALDDESAPGGEDLLDVIRRRLRSHGAGAHSLLNGKNGLAATNGATTNHNGHVGATSRSKSAAKASTPAPERKKTLAKPKARRPAGKRKPRSSSRSGNRRRL